MASSQVEFATASPFGCVLRDHNSRRDRRRDTNTNPNPSPKSQRNFKDLVRDHLQSCISLSPRALKNHERDENSDQCGGFSCFGGGTNANSSTMRAKEVNKQKQAQGQAQAGAKAQGENQTSFITGSAKKEPQETCLARSESGCSDISVSSLVQKWRGLEANHGAGFTTTTTASSPTTMEGGMTRMNSGVSMCESTVTTLDEGGEKEEMPTTTATTATEEEEMEEKEKREREGVRVVDIVRKWPVDESGACLARSETRKENKGKGEGEGKKISPRLVSSARVRGRQAIVDVFTRMERERYREIGLLQSKHVVAKFPKRGRIQALLRLRLLRRDQTIEEQRRPPLPVVGTSWCHAAPAVTSRREKFHSSVDQDSVSSRTTSKETPDTSHKHTQTTSTSKHITEKATPKHEPIVRRSLTEAAKSEPGTENASESSKQAVQISEIQNACTICDKSKKIGPKEELNVPDHPNNNVGAENFMTSNENSEPESSYNGGYWEQGEGEDYYYEDNEANQCYYEPNLDWVNDIARPRSYWEDLRQAWYQEVFNTKSQDEEIRQLLERGSVSNVLASDFKERMERLILNSTTHISSYNHVEVGSDNEQSVSEQNTTQLLQSGCVSAVLSSDFRENMNQVLMNRMQIEDDEQEDNEEEEDEQENCETVGIEDESSVIHRYQNVSDFYEQNSTPSPCDSDHATSYGHTTHEGSLSSKNPSIEMELIYDLRSHMEQLYREMAELRKSVTSCMDMQMKMQHSTKEKVSAPIIGKEQAEKKDSSNRRKPKKGTCCICYEKKVDSLLYRCGHMCTCFTCANELQWGSGKCPICRAQIIDVVRAHP